MHPLLTIALILLPSVTVVWLLALRALTTGRTGYAMLGIGLWVAAAVASALVAMGAG